MFSWGPKTTIYQLDLLQMAIANTTYVSEASNQCAHATSYPEDLYPAVGAVLLARCILHDGRRLSEEYLQLLKHAHSFATEGFHPMASTNHGCEQSLILEQLA
jgi:hypothetical protein